MPGRRCGRRECQPDGRQPQARTRRPFHASSLSGSGSGGWVRRTRLRYPASGSRRATSGRASCHSENRSHRVCGPRSLHTVSDRCVRAGFGRQRRRHLPHRKMPGSCRSGTPRLRRDPGAHRLRAEHERKAPQVRGHDLHLADVTPSPRASQDRRPGSARAPRALRPAFVPSGPDVASGGLGT